MNFPLLFSQLSYLLLTLNLYRISQPHFDKKGFFSILVDHRKGTLVNMHKHLLSLLSNLRCFKNMIVERVNIEKES